MRIARQDGGRKPDLLQYFGDACLDVGPARRVQAQPFRDDLAHRQARVEAAVGVLEDELHRRAQCAQLFLRFAIDARPRGRRSARRFFTSRSSAKPSELLPEPDSPTRPSVSPALSASDTCSTARTVPARLRNSPPRPAKCTLSGPARRISSVLCGAGGGGGRGDGGEQQLGVFGLRAGEELLHRRGLDDLPGAHDGDAVGDLPHHRQIVGDEQHRHAALFLQPLEQGKDLPLQRDVERGGRLVGDQQLGIVGDGNGDHRPLALAAGKLVRVGARAGEQVLEPDLAVERGELLLAVAGARVMRAPGFHHLPADRMQRV